jgi:nicotinate-nucleotide adenylyltransferase
MTVGRPGAAEPDWNAIATFLSAGRLAQLKSHHVEMPQVGISSRDLRRRAAEGRSLRYQVPRAVERYIEAAGLYANR